jgi:serine/threonine protein kinase
LTSWSPALFDFSDMSEVFSFNQGANIFLRTSVSDFTYRLLLHGEKQGQNEAEPAPLIGCICFGDFGESMAAASDPKPLHSCLSFISGALTAVSSAPSPAKKKASNCSFLLSRTRGTEAIKSPEVFRIRGNEASKTPVTLASDVWSIGCLLYELVVQELLFENGASMTAPQSYVERLTDGLSCR